MEQILLYLSCWISHHKLHKSEEYMFSSAYGQSTVSVDIPDEEVLGDGLGDGLEFDDGEDDDGDIPLGEEEVELPEGEGEEDDGEIPEGDEEGERLDGLGDILEVEELDIKF